MYNVTTCHNLNAGDFCDVTCNDGYILDGKPSVFTCPVDNINQETQPYGVLPACMGIGDFFLLSCQRKSVYNSNPNKKIFYFLKFPSKGLIFLLTDINSCSK